MNLLKRRFEDILQRLAYLLYDNAKRTLVIVALLTSLFALGFSKITIETSTEKLFHPDDKTFINYESFKREFGQDSAAVIAIRSDHIFSIPFLTRLRDLHLDIEQNVPYVDEITSLYNVTNIQGNQGDLIVEDLLEKFPHNEQELRALKQRVQNEPLYQDLLISKQGNFTVMTVRPVLYLGTETDITDIETLFDSENPLPQHYPEPAQISNAQKAEFAQAIARIVDKYRAEDFEISLSGGPIIDREHAESIRSDVGIMVAIAALMVFFILYLIFRRVSGVMFPLMVVALTLISIFGLMGYLSIPITPISQLIPSLMIAIGVADSVHFLSLFYLALSQHDRRTAVGLALKQSGLAMLFTSLTTAAGFVSFSQARLLPIAELGILTPIGIILALVFTYILLPALIGVSHITAKPQRHTKISPQKLLVLTGRYASLNPIKTVAGFTLLLILSMTGLNDLRYSHNLVAWLPADNPTRIQTETINRELRTTVSLEVIIDTKKENGLYDPKVMNDLANTAQLVQTMTVSGISIAKAYSVADTLKQIHRALNENRTDYYTIPDSRALIAQELTLFENSGTDDLEEIVDNQFSKARISIRLPFIDAVYYLPLREKLETAFNKTFGDYAEVTVTGNIDLLVQSFMNVLKTMSSSYIIAFIVIGCLMLLIFGDLRIGLISLAPNLFPIILALSFMGITGIAIDMFTVLMGGIALGLVVDSSVHFLYHFQRHYQQTSDVQLSIERSLSSVGRAILYTSTILVGAFLIYTFASVGTLVNLGLVLIVAITAALAADVALVPAMLTLVYRKYPNTHEEISHEIV